MMVALRSRSVLVLAVGLAAAGVVGLQLTGPPAQPGSPVAGPAGTSNVVVENPTTGAVESEAAIQASSPARTEVVIENPATGAVESVTSLDH
jgi:hypothetical protein